MRRCWKHEAFLRVHTSSSSFFSLPLLRFVHVQCIVAVGIRVDDHRNALEGVLQLARLVQDLGGQHEELVCRLLCRVQEIGCLDVLFHPCAIPELLPVCARKQPKRLPHAVLRQHPGPLAQSQHMFQRRNRPAARGENKKGRKKIKKKNKDR